MIRVRLVVFLKNTFSLKSVLKKNQVFSKIYEILLKFWKIICSVSWRDTW